MDLALIWAVIIMLGVVIYVLLDGFDLGVGILFPFAQGHDERDVMMNSIAPVWDGNETWLILGGASLFAAFPKAYAILLSSLYLPLMLMLFALILRGVAFEFRFKAITSRYLWDIAFSGGSMLAAFTQGIVLGAVVQGIPSANTAGFFHWLTPFTILTGLAVICGYAMLGASWLILKNRRRFTRLGLPPRANPAAIAACFHCDSEYLDTSATTSHRRTLVQPAEFLLSLTGALHHFFDCGVMLVCIETAAQ